jgi:SPP1 gp7 family putative phage head morphogenesis protein
MGYHAQVLAAKIGTSQAPVVVSGDRLGARADAAIQKQWRRIQALLRSKKAGYWVFREKLKKLIDEMLLAGIDTIQDGLEKIAVSTSKATQKTVFDSLPDGYKQLLITEDKATPDQQRQIKSMLFDPMSIDAAKKIVEAPTAGLGWKSRIIQQTKLGDPSQIATAIVNWRAGGQSPKALEATLLPMLQGVRTSARRVARTEAARVAQATRMGEYEQLGDLVVGYQIHATMDSRTRPHHAARSGEIYYKSPKPGQKSIAAMPTPPHEADGTVAHNCRCYLTPVMDIQVQIENDPAAKAVFADNEKILVPDPLVYAQWFKTASAAERAAAVGKKRLAIMQSKLGAEVTTGWEYFLDPKTGKLLSASQLQAETPEALAKRLQAVRMLLTRRKELAKAVSMFGYVPPNPKKIKGALINVAGMLAPAVTPSSALAAIAGVTPASIPKKIITTPFVAPPIAKSPVVIKNAELPTTSPVQTTVPSGLKINSSTPSFPISGPTYTWKNPAQVGKYELVPPGYVVVLDKTNIGLFIIPANQLPKEAAEFMTISGTKLFTYKATSPVQAASTKFGKPSAFDEIQPGNSEVQGVGNGHPVYKHLGALSDFSKSAPFNLKGYDAVYDPNTSQVHFVHINDLPLSGLEPWKYIDKQTGKVSSVGPYDPETMIALYKQTAQANPPAPVAPVNTSPVAPVSAPVTIPANITPAKPVKTLPEKVVKNLPPEKSTGPQTFRDTRKEISDRLKKVLKNKPDQPETDTDLWNVPTLPAAPKPSITLKDKEGNHIPFVPHNDLSAVAPISRVEWSKEFPELNELGDAQRLGGSTGADLVRDKNGRKWVRKMGASKGHIQSEADADALYAALGVPVPASRLHETEGALTKIAEHIEGVPLANKFTDPDVQKKIQANFAADALLGNWDVIGMSADNIIVAKDGTPYRIDNGGALNYRAQGAEKRDTEWDEHPTELWSMSNRENIGKQDAQGKAAQIFSQIPWMDAVGQMEKIVKSKDSIVKAAPVAQRDIIAKRIEQMRDIAATSRTLVDDGFDPEYAKEFTKHQQNLRRLGISKSMPKRLGDVSIEGMASRNVELNDENGKLFDNLRDHGGITDRYRKYLEKEGKGDFQDFYNYAIGQGGSSKSKESNVLKMFMQSMQPGTDFTNTYSSHKSVNKAKFIRETGMSEADYKKYANTMTSMHALTSELLRNTDMLGNNRAQGFISVYRTETEEAFKDQAKLQAERWDKPSDIPADEFSPGIAESYATFRTVEVHNQNLIRIDIPHHRAFSSYLFGKDPGAINVPTFLRDRENETIVMAHGYGAKSWGSAKQIFRKGVYDWNDAN